jgi:hypothetical protein
VSEPVAADERLYATMQRLMVMYARRQTSEIPGPRGVVKRQDALDAVIQLAAVVDEAVHADAIPVDRGMHAAAMLMVLREFVQPLPPDWDGDGCTDYLNADLAMMVTALRKARKASPRPRPRSVPGLRIQLPWQLITTGPRLSESP